MATNPVRAIIVGAGTRARVRYAQYALDYPERLQIVGVADPNVQRRRLTAEIYGIPSERCFENAEELARQPKFADAVINGTNDAEHVPTSLPLLRAGYDVLLEKPISPKEEELIELVETAKATGKKVFICHVLRYTPFYSAIYKRVAAGDIGRITSMRSAEYIGYDHMAAAYVRGPWRRREETSPLLLSKCCHDLDLLCWMKAGVKPEKVASFGHLTYFREKNAPEGSGSRCLVDCKIEPECPYSAKKSYIENECCWYYLAWREFADQGIEPNKEQRIASLKTDNPHGRCVWRCDNTIVDHQSVNIDFEDETVATHDMVGGVPQKGRKIHLVGTKGEIEGSFEGHEFTIRTLTREKGLNYHEETIAFDPGEIQRGGGHGGGDLRLVDDFVKVLMGESPSDSTTDLMDSIHGHLVVYAADKAMQQGTVCDIDYNKYETR